jgi:hypothetical protein
MEVTTSPITALTTKIEQDSLGEVINSLCINFLLYVVLIIVFYMLVRFYLEEDTMTTNDTVLRKNMSEEEHITALELTDVVEKETDTFIEKETSSSKSQRSNAPPTFLNVNEWGEPEGTKHEVIQRAVFCAIGLHVTFCIWGLLQERMLTQTYDGEFFVYSYGLVFINRLGGLLLSMYLMYHFNVAWVKSPLWEYSFPSVANMLSSWCQYEALKYVSFPTQMLAKGINPIYIHPND